MIKFLDLIKKDPIKALISISVVIAIVAASIVIFAATIFAIYVPVAIRGKFYEETGFYLNAENIFVNILTGSIQIQNAKITSPEGYADREFLKIHSIRMNVDTMALTKARFNIYKADIKIEELKCVRMSASKFNLRDFFDELEKIASFAPGKSFKGMRIEIDSCEYLDISENRIRMNRRIDKKIELQFDKIPSSKESKLYVKEAFDKIDASFMTTVLKLTD